MNIGLEIAGLKINILNNPFCTEMESIKPFLTVAFDKCDVEYEIIISDQEFAIENKCILRDKTISIYSQHEDKYIIQYYTENGDVYCHAFFDFNSHKNKLYIAEDFVNKNSDSNILLELLAIDFLLIHCGRIMMQGVFVEYDSYGIVFSGATGSGKAEQSNIWVEHLGARIINSEKVIIDTTNEELLAWGSPWDDNNNFYINQSKKIKAIIFLNHNDNNIFSEVTGSKLYRKLIPRMSMVNWNADLLEKSIEVVDVIIEKANVYQYDCAGSNEAVDILKNQLFGR